MTLREARERRKLTQEALATKVGVDQATISYLENGKVDSPAWPIVCRIARALHRKPEELFPVPDVEAKAS